MSIAEIALPTGARLDRQTVAGPFERSDFRGATLDRSARPLFRAPRGNVFRDCRFDGVDLRAIDPGTSRFERCTFDGADLSGWTAMTAEFVECRFAGRVADVRFYGRPWGPASAGLEPRRAVNEFHGNDFRRAELERVVFLMGIDVGRQRWPAAAEYVRLDRIHQRLTRGRAEILDWKDLDARNEALEMLRTLSVLYIRQSEVVARRAEPGTDTRPEVQSRVWETLAAAL